MQADLLRVEGLECLSQPVVQVRMPGLFQTRRPSSFAVRIALDGKHEHCAVSHDYSPSATQVVTRIDVGVQQRAPSEHVRVHLEHDLGLRVQAADLVQMPQRHVRVLVEKGRRRRRS